MEETPYSASLEHTPTWAVATICTVFVLVSLLLERGIHNCGKRLKRKNQKPLSEALEKMKEELMLMGFISLLLSVFQPVLAEFCIPLSSLEHMLPCRFDKNSAFVNETFSRTGTSHNMTKHSRKLLLEWLEEHENGNKCTLKGKVPMISTEGLHQLHIFIFAMAIVHLCYSCLTMLLGRIKVYWWSSWENEVHASAKPRTGPPLKFRQTTFVQKHARRPWSTLNVFDWIVAFVRHLSCKPVTKSDYLSLRAGFIKNYNLHDQFNFHGYVTRVLEHDFKVVVGISAPLWAFVILFLLMNVNGWHTYFWMAFLPLILILIIGTKLQYIITELAVEIAQLQDKTGQEAVIRPRDDLFWFRKPRFLLYLIHFTLFQNAFELAFFFWVWTTFGFDTCFMDSVAFITIRLIVGLAVQVLCSYSTLPLYVIVTQMGSHYNKAIFTKRIHKSMKEWRHVARSNIRQKRAEPPRLYHEHKHLEEQLQSQEPHRLSLQELLEKESPPVHGALEMELPTAAILRIGTGPSVSEQQEK